MAKSKIRIEFVQIPIWGDEFIINVDTGNGVVPLQETFTSVRDSNYKVQARRESDGGTLAMVANNYFSAWRLDYPSYGSIIAVPDSSTQFDIELNHEHWQITGVEGRSYTDGHIAVTIDNAPIQSQKSLKIEGYSAGSNPCSNSLVSFTATGATSLNVYVNNALTLNNVTSPFDLTLNRGSVSVVRVTDINGGLIGERNVTPPRKLLASDISTQVVNLESGATINTDVTFISDSIQPLEYSLGGNFQASNVFSGISEGDYTLTVRDAWGCSASKLITIDGITELTEPVFYISEINPLRFALVEEGKRNFKNTLSFNELKQISYPFYHKYLEQDIITTQIKTNAKYLNIYSIDCDKNKQILTPVKKTENTGLEVKSTVTYFDIGGGRSAAYFGVVDLLDPLTNSVLETVDYGFTTPEWAKEGSYVTIDGIGMVQVDKIGYSDFYDSFILEFNIASVGTTETTIYASYNIQPYEVYEFETYMSANPDLFQIVIEAGRSESMIDFTYISEMIKRVNDDEKLYEINYSDIENKGGMVYATGITHKIRLYGWSDYIGEQDTEGYNGDTEYHKTDDSIFRTEEFTFPRLSSEMAHKLRLIISHKNLTINNIFYKLAESPEIKTDANNNFKTFSAVMKNGGELFLTKAQEITNTSGSVENESLSGALEASKGKSLILWTKQNG